MRFIQLFMIAMLFVSAALGQSTSNVPCGIKQGGTEIFAKTGCQIKVRDQSIFKVDIQLSDIGTNGNVGVAVAPYAGTISSIKCGVAGASGVAETILTGSINGVAITNGAVTVASTASTFQTYTATPTAANTLAVNDIIQLSSDGGTTGTPAAACNIVITP